MQLVAYLLWPIQSEGNLQNQRNTYISELIEGLLQILYYFHEGSYTTVQVLFQVYSVILKSISSLTTPASMIVVLLLYHLLGCGSLDVQTLSWSIASTAGSFSNNAASPYVLFT